MVEQKSNKASLLTRSATILAVVVAALGVLLCFPEYVGYVIVAWAVWIGHGFLNKNRRWGEASALAIYPVAKGLNWNWVLLGLVGLSVFVAIALFVNSRRRSSTFGWAERVGVFLLFPVAVGYAVDRYFEASSPPTAGRLGAPIVCLGDSLTAGGYPDELASMVSVPVKNFGGDGFDTEDALGAVRNIAACRPQVVIVEIGGHDFRKGRSRTETRNNLVQLIEAFHLMEAKVILVEVPRGFVHDPYWGLERELARKYDLQLVSDTAIRNLIFWSPIVPPGCWVESELHLSDDGLHPNARGNAFLARKMLAGLRQLLGGQIGN